MVLPRASPLKSAFKQSTFRTAGARTRSQSWRQAGRRFYASDHGPKKASSDLPWLIGSVVVTVPSAAWLWQQGPTKGEHGHGHDEHKEHDEPEEKPAEEESKDEGGDEGKEEEEDKPKDEGGDEPKDEGKSEDKSEDSGDEEGEKDTPETSDDEEKPSEKKKK